MITDCNICEELSGSPISEFGEEYNKIVASKNNVIYESDNLVVIPSLGPLNSSHVMVVPKSHFNSFAEIGSEVLDEINKIKEKIREYGRVVLGREYLFFESGAGRLTNHAGGCIVHAHLHALSLCSDFDARIAKEIRLSPVGEIDFFSEADIDFGYVLYIDEMDKWFFCNNPLLPSQFLRYLYAQCNGVDAYWNWRRHINIEGVKSVISRFSGFRG
ncbi:MAG: HIT domain-containing protein [Oceanospirillales bacterium]|nr:HIT domain-containing protein [Oceanospirillales bacterium]